MYKLALLSIFIMLHFVCPAQKMKYKRNSPIPDNALNIKKFGAKGDGITNDYPAFLAIADYINKKGTGSVFLPKGNYYIGVYQSKTDSNKDIEFKDCNHLKIIGKNAKISLNGNFKRTADYKNKKYWFSYARTVVPLSFSNCKSILIEGIEIDGNVSQITRDSNVVENQADLLIFSNCEDVKVKNVFVHHAQTDGIYIIGSNSNSRNITMTNVISANNGRQGMSIIGLLNGTFQNCEFINTGITGGTYGYHSPAAGVDIEPHAETVVKNILFKNCTFKNNKGGQFLCSSPTTTSEIVLDSCHIDAGSSTSPYQIITAANNIVIKNSVIDCGAGKIFVTWQSTPGSNVTLSNNTIKSSSNGILSVSIDDRDSVTLSNNSLIFTGKELLTYFPYLRTKNLSFFNNSIYIPSTAIKSKKATSLIENGIISKNNKFYSDSNFKPNVSYRGTKNVSDN